MASVQLREVQKNYGGRTALHELSVDVADGEFYCLLGPSGAGKTTTLKVIAGLERPQRGTVLIGGKAITDVEPNERNVAMCFESYALYPQANVFQNLVSPLRSPRHRVSPDQAERSVRRVARLLGIEHLLDRQVTELSNGQRQRVALGRVLVRPAAAYLLDEPLAHLDAKLRAEMRAELKAISRDVGTTTVYVTHDYVEALSLADRIGVLDQGRIRQVGTPEQLWTSPADSFVAGALGKPGITLLEGTVTDDLEFVLAGGSVRLPLPPLTRGPGHRVRVGLRARDLTLAGSAEEDPEWAEQQGANPTARRVPGTIYVIEHLGRQTEVTVQVDGALLALVLPRSEAAGLTTDQRVAVRVDARRMHVFDADDAGKRVNRDP